MNGRRHLFRLAAMIVTFTFFAASHSSGAQDAADPMDRFDQLDRNDDDLVTRDELRQRRVFDALDKNGDDEITRDEAREWLTNQVRSRRGARSMDIPKALRDVAIKVHRGIQYVERDVVDPNLLSLDIFTPVSEYGDDAGTNGSNALHPVLVMIHGGGWRTGEKANAAVADLKSRFFTANNCVLISVNYRLSPAVVHPAHVEDVAAAMAWVHDHIEEYGGDPNRLFVMGHSAGAHLAALVSTDASRLAAHEKGPQIIQGTILLDGAAYDLGQYVDAPELRVPAQLMYESAFGPRGEAWRDASPAHHIAPGKHIPPFLIFHVGNRLKSEIESKELTEKLREAGSESAAFHAPDKDHGSINRDVGLPGDEPTRLILEFVQGASPTDLQTRPDINEGDNPDR